MKHRIINPDIREELVKTLQLALPIALAQIAYITMGTVDTLMVGGLGAASIGGIGLGSSLFSIVLVLGVGLLSSMDTLISQAEGAKQEVRSRHLLYQGLWLALLASIPLSLCLVFLGNSLSAWGVTPEVRKIAQAYVNISVWSLPFSFIQLALQRYWQAKQKASIVTWVLILANLCNILGNLVFIFGRFGFPQMGALGTAVSTLLCRIFMAVFLWIYTEKEIGILRPSIREKFSIAPQITLLRELLRIGLPASVTIGLEVGVFSMASIFAARISAASAAAHQIVLSIVSVTFMIPLGIGAATSVRVGFKLGAQNSRGALHAGWVGILLATGIMTVSSICMLIFPRWVLGIFTHEPDVTHLGLGILFFAALFQIFDGTQVAAAGALRGLGKTKIPMIANFLGHYAIGLTLGLWLAFHQNWGLRGIWAGLGTGLCAVALSLTWYWNKKTRKKNAPAH